MFGGDKKKEKQRNENGGTCNFFNVDGDSEFPEMRIASTVSL